MADVENTQLKVFSVAEGNAVEASQAKVFAVAAEPALDVYASQMLVRAVGDPIPSQTIDTQFKVFAIARGRVTDPIIRVWTYTLDGHDYYVVRLPQETLVYDLHAEQWYTWGSESGNTWRAGDGINWIGGTSNAAVYGSNVIVGDDTNGALYWLDPDADQDEGPLDNVDGSRISYSFQRTAYGQIVTRSYDVTPCWSLRLLGAIGETPEGSEESAIVNTVNLAISDDWGHTYRDCGNKELAFGDYTARVDWRSLGSIRAPGRLFRITDYGALKRIDSLEMGDKRG